MGKIKISSRLRKFLSYTLAAVLVLSIGLTVAYFSDREEAGFSVTANYPSYNVTYDSNGGTFDTAKKNIVKYEDGIVISGTYKEPTNSNIGLFFDGWYTNSACTEGNEFDPTKDTAKLKKDITVYAKWSIVEYSIKYNSNGGSGTMADSSHTYGVAKALTANSFTKNGYDFIGWATTPSGEVVYEDKEVVDNLTTTDGAVINLYAVWEIQKEPIFQVWAPGPNNEPPSDKYHQYRDDITKIEFLKTYNPNTKMTYGPWDVSDAQDGSVMAYIVGDTLYICANVRREAKVIANPNSSFAFGMFVNLTTFDGTNFDTSRALEMNRLFVCNFTMTDVIGVEGWDMSKVKDTQHMFGDCQSLKNINTSTWKLTSLINGESMFYGCDNLTALDTSGWTMGKVENLNSMFNACESLGNIDVSNWNVGQAKDMCLMFGYCHGMTKLDLSKWDVSKVQDMSNMFMDCSNLTTIGAVGAWNPVSVETFDSMFYNCGRLNSLDTSGWKVDNATDMEYMFYKCAKLPTVNVTKWNVENLESAQSMFNGCTLLNNINVSKWKTSALTNVHSMFMDCVSLGAINISNWNMANIKNSYSSTNMFRNCAELKELTIPASLKYIGNSFASECQKLIDITFKHSRTDEIKLPTAGSTYGAFYVGNPYSADNLLLTNLVTKNDTVKNYEWITDHRGLVPILRMWYSNANEDFHHSDYKSKITTAEFVDKADVPSVVAAGPWDVSYKQDGSVTAWLTTEDDGATYHLTIAGNGYGKIFANPESSFAFYNFTSLKSITNTGLLETGGLKTTDGTVWIVNPVYNMSRMFSKCKSLTSIDLTGWDTSSVNDVNSMFTDCSSLINVEGIGDWNVEKVVNFSAIFANCSNLTSIDLSQWKTKSGENFNSMFSGCGKLTTIGDTTNWTTPMAKNMSYMFYRCYDLTEVNTTNWDVSDVVSMYSMFESCTELTSVGDTNNWCTDSLTTLARTFFDCQELKSLNTSNWNTENVTTLEMTFFACESLTELDLSKWNTSKVTTMESTFYDCCNIERLDVDPKEITKADGTKYTTWDVSKVKSLDSTFLLCNDLVEIDVSDWVTSSNTRLTSTFGDCESLTKLDVSKWDTSKVTNAKGTFADCEKLTTVGDLGNWDTSLIKSTEQMFSMCKALQSINISTWDMSSNTNNEHMFWYCDDLTELVIPSSMTIFDEGFAALCQKLTYIKFNHPADVTITFEPAGYVDDNPRLDYYAESDEYGPFFVGSPYSQTNLLETDIVTENSAVMGYKWKEDNRGGIPILRSWTDESTDDFHNETYRSKITTAELADKITVPSSPVAGPWDVSADQNGSVMAWLTLTTADDASTTNKDETTYHLTISGNGYGKVFANPDSSYAFYDLYNLTSFKGINLLDTRMAINLEGMFMYCESLTGLDVSNWDTSNVTNMAGLFYWCNDLAAIDVSKWNTEKVTDLNSTFYGCRTLSELRVKDWKTANVTSLEWTFAGCQELDIIDVSSWNTSKVENMAGTFYDCWDIVTLDLKNWVVDNVTDMGLMFGTDFNSSLKTIGDVSGWNTSKVENMGLMFYDCYNLLSVDVANWNTGNVTNMDSMFRGCEKLTELDVSKWNVSKVKNMCEMFISCSDLPYIDISKWDCSSLDYTAYGNANSGMFAYCDSLTELIIPASMSQISSEFAYSCENLSNITFLHSADDPITFQSAGLYIGAFYAGDPYNNTNMLSTTLNTENANVINYLWGKDNRYIENTARASLDPVVEDSNIYSTRTLNIDDELEGQDFIESDEAIESLFSNEGNDEIYVENDGLLERDSINKEVLSEESKQDTPGNDLFTETEKLNNNETSENESEIPFNSEEKTEDSFVSEDGVIEENVVSVEDETLKDTPQDLTLIEVLEGSMELAA